MIEVEAGCTLGDLTALLASKGWILPVLPGTGAVTIGGAIANDVHGKNHRDKGSFGQHVNWIDISNPKGIQRLTPNDRAFQATIGGLGQTGAILRANIQLMPCPGSRVSVKERRMDNIDAFLDAFDQSKAPFQVGWIDTTAKGRSLGRGIFEEGELATGSAGPTKTPLRIPLPAPKATLSPPVVRVFNAAYLRRCPPAGRTVSRTLQQFFFPLDGLSDWNKLYGRPGFHQFQCVVPEGAEDVLRQILTTLAESGGASPLAVIKLLGPGHVGDLSFPMAGTTLAVDLKNDALGRQLIASFNKLAVTSGGRVYLAKDSLLSAELAHTMLPDLLDWQETVKEIDPQHHFETDLVRRLALRGRAYA